MKVPVLVLNGPVGVGKTSLLGEIAELLQEASVSHVALDFDALTQMHPAPPDDRFNLRLGVENLRAVWANGERAGAERLVVAGVLEEQGHLDQLLDAVPGAKAFVVRLIAPVAVLQERLRSREAGSALDWHVDRAAELAEILEASDVSDAVVDTSDRTLRSTALEILEKAGWA